MKILFCGDTSPTKDNAHLFAQVATDALFTDTRPLFENADFSIVNLECALTDWQTPINKIGPSIAAPVQTAQVLKDLGVTHCGLSNNHFYDRGPKGVQDTLAALDQAGLVYTGFGANKEDSCKDLVLEKDGKTLCVIAVCEHEYTYALDNRMGCRGFDEFETPLQIRAAKERYDQVAVLYHGGKEHCQYPSPRLRKACHAMAKSGADLILCQHSHCIGCYEQFEGCHILYGQGNFHFVKTVDPSWTGWYQGLIVSYDTDTGLMDFIPVVFTQYAIRLADKAERESILTAFHARGKHLADGTWLEGWHAFCEANRDSYTKAIADACTEGCSEAAIQKFAHYLDCEAHTDVWRELFPTYNLTNE